MTHIRGGHIHYVLQRDTDVGGISGTGPVGYVTELLGDGIDPGDGLILLWDTTFVDPVTGEEKPSRGIEWLPDIETLLTIHGHHGATRLLPLVDPVAMTRCGELLADAAPTLQQVAKRLRLRDGEAAA